MGCGRSKQGDMRLARSKSLASKEMAATTEELPVSSANFVLKSSANILKNYKIIGKIGQGGFGSIVKAHHFATDSVRAIKSVQKGDDMSAGLQAMEIEDLKNEIELMRITDHPNILQMYEYFEDSNRFYMSMECCEGGTLADVCGNPAMTEMKAKVAMSKLLNCINYLHSKSIVHRDLKPENVLLKKPWEFETLKLCDFGLARKLKPEEKLEEGSGSMQFAAPEVFLRLPYSFAVDVWALGVMAHMFIVGKMPFKILTFKNVDDIREHLAKGVDLNADIPELQSVSEQAKDFIQKLLTHDQDKRITAAQALKHPWLDGISAMKSDLEVTSLLQEMRSIPNRGPLAKAAHAYVAAQLVSQHDQRNLSLIFSSLDTDNKGSLDLASFLKGYEAHAGALVSDKEKEDLAHLFKQLDTDGSGSLDYSEFISAFIGRSQESSLKSINEVFKAFDQDGSGTISPDEITQILSFGCDKRVNDTVVKQIMQQVDANGDGEISITEFKEMLLLDMTKT